MISVEKHPNIDTRTAERVPTLEELKAGNESHIRDVSACMDYIADKIKERGRNHDSDKLTDIEGQLRDMKATIEEGKDFTELPWYQNHKNERHHLVYNSELEDINLIDILEGTIDRLTATYARTGNLTNKDVLDIWDSISAVDCKVALLFTLADIASQICPQISESTMLL